MWIICSWILLHLSRNGHFIKHYSRELEESALQCCVMSSCSLHNATPINFFNLFFPDDLVSSQNNWTGNQSHSKMRCKYSSIRRYNSISLGCSIELNIVCCWKAADSWSMGIDTAPPAALMCSFTGDKI